jgi:hypothetical protein
MEARLRLSSRFCSRRCCVAFHARARRARQRLEQVEALGAAESGELGPPLELEVVQAVSFGVEVDDRQVEPLAAVAAAALDRLSRRERFTDDDDLVFVGTSGKHLDGSALRRRFKSALALAKLRTVGFHDLRHSFGTLAVQVFPLTDVKAFLGHSDIQTTMVYVHFTPQHDAAEKLSRLLAEGGDFVSPPVSRNAENLGKRREARNAGQRLG